MSENLTTSIDEMVKLLGQLQAKVRELYKKYKSNPSLKEEISEYIKTTSNLRNSLKDLYNR
jgi:predicted DNA-binding protein YlxM (UPF0122 family)